jgi:predicted N-acetyltransferase YhbS
MEFRPYTTNDTSIIKSLFISVFTKSEGESEGALIGNLTQELITTDENNLYGFVASNQGQIIGAVFFSRLTFQHDINAFILAPVAIHNDYQGKGLGQQLINYGIKEIRDKGIRLVITYGDPKFYAKVGFRPISEEIIPAPFKLSRPEGWLGQSLTENSIEAISGSCSCVTALNKPVYW